MSFYFFSCQEEGHFRKSLQLMNKFTQFLTKHLSLKRAAYCLLLDRKHSQFTQYLAHPNSSYNYLIRRPESFSVI